MKINFSLNILIMLLFVWGSPNFVSTANQSLKNGRIVFASAKSGVAQIYTIEADGSNLNQLTLDEGDNYFPRWSPDGTHIAYIHEQRIFIANADGTNVSEVKNTSGAQYFDWSPDGTRLVFAQHEDISVINLADSTTTKLTNTRNVMDESPVWSPDGTQIAFSSSGSNPVPSPLDGFALMQVFVMDAGGKNPTRISQIGDHAALGSLNWTSDNRLIYSSAAAPDYGIFSYSFTDNNVTQLTDSKVNCWNPALSPDETKIAFVRDGDQLVVINRDGSDPIIILDMKHILDIDWQPIFEVLATNTPE